MVQEGGLRRLDGGILAALDTGTQALLTARHAPRRTPVRRLPRGGDGAAQSARLQEGLAPFGAFRHLLLKFRGAESGN